MSTPTEERDDTGNDDPGTDETGTDEPGTDETGTDDTDETGTDGTGSDDTPPDVVDDGQADHANPGRTRRSWVTAILAAGLTWLSLIAVFTMESSVADYDPLYMRVLVERTAAFGGSYYSNGVHNKGPLEPFVYSLALHIGGFDAFWFVIAIFTFIAALAVAVAGAAVVRADHGGRNTIVAVMVVIVTLLTVSGADYAGVLYSRNMSVALLSIAFATGMFHRAWKTPRRRALSVLVAAGSIGIAVQTLITAAFTGGAVLVWLMWRRRSGRVWRLPTWVALPLVAGVVFFSAPLYYRVFGPWDDFVDGFWTHARYMSAGTGRGLTNQIGLGWTNLKSYYRERPELVVIIVGWAAFVAARWRHSNTHQRGMRLLFAAWWFGAWIELVLSQRYSSHYFSVVAVPTILMATDLATASVNWLAARFELRAEGRLLPLGLALLVILSGRPPSINGGIEATATVRSAADFTKRREANFPPRVRTTRAILDLVSTDGDPLLMWTNYPWPYVDLHRVSATRYIWKSFMVGEIYLGATSDEYILPSTWSNFADDVAESQPAAYLVETVTPLNVENPFADYVSANFTPVYSDDEETLSLRNDLVTELQTVPADARAATVSQNTSIPMCNRIDGTFAANGSNTIEILDRSGTSIAQIALQVDAAGVASEVQLVGGPTSDLDTPPNSGVTKFSLIAGRRSVVMFVHGRIVAAVRAPVGASIVWRNADVVGNAAMAASPAVTGCG